MIDGLTIHPLMLTEELHHPCTCATNNREYHGCLTVGNTRSRSRCSGQLMIDLQRPSKSVDQIWYNERVFARMGSSIMHHMS